MIPDKTNITVEKTGITTYYAVTVNGTDYTVTDMYDVNSDYTERTIIELTTQQEPGLKLQKRIALAIDDYEASS